MNFYKIRNGNMFQVGSPVKRTVRYPLGKIRIFKKKKIKANCPQEADNFEGHIVYI